MLFGVLDLVIDLDLRALTHHLRILLGFSAGIQWIDVSCHVILLYYICKRCGCLCFDKFLYLIDIDLLALHLGRVIVI